MANQQNNGPTSTQPAKPDPAPAPTAALVSITVAPNRTVEHIDEDGVASTVHAGHTIKVSRADAARLRELGFVLDTDGKARTFGVVPGGLRNDA